MPRGKRSVRARAAVCALAGLLVLSGCSADDVPPGARVVTAAPDGDLTVVADADPAAASVGASRVLFRRADVAVVARDGDLAGTLLGASAAVGLGVPLLLDGDADGALTAELRRLGVRQVLAVGDVDAARLGVRAVRVPAAAAAVTAATGLRFAGDRPVDGDGVAAVAALGPRELAALAPPGARKATHGPPSSRLPHVARAESRDDVVVLASGPESLAGVATARAAGARVVVTGQPDPRTTGDAVQALGDDGTDAVVALGPGFGAEDGLDWKVAAARTGAQLPGGGQVLFPGRLLVALYGSPGSGALGVLGEQDLDASIERARQTAAQYDGLVDVPVVPTFEIIATVASSAAGADGDYSSEIDPEQIRPWVEAAGEAGIYVVLDLQPGRTDFLTQAKRYSSLLELPNVGLALDPEWRLAPDQVHLTDGSVGADEVNGVITWLADLTRENALPQKLLVLHQFRLDTLADRQRIDLSRDELAVLVHADGQGGQGDKQATWRALHDAPLPAGPLYWGWKNFYDEDAPMLTPQQTVEQVQPVPDLVSYQ